MLQQRGRMAAVLMMALLTEPAYGESDPFQSNPGPAPQLAPAAPKPALRAIRPPPEPEPVIAAPQPPPAPVSTFDGTWAGTSTCGPTGSGEPGFVRAMVATVHEGHMELVVGRQGDPGGQHMAGLVERNGVIKLIGDGVSAVPRHRGERYAIVLDGSFEAGRTFRAHGQQGGRTCDLVLGRSGS